MWHIGLTDNITDGISKFQFQFAMMSDDYEFIEFIATNLYRWLVFITAHQHKMIQYVPSCHAGGGGTGSEG